MRFDRDAFPADIRGYHRRTRHAPQRYAIGPAFLDWESQPNPFRRFDGAPLTLLPVPDPSPTPDWRGLFSAAPRPLELSSLGRFLELALGVSAWKAVEGATWAVRNNPSSGNLHPTEAYVALPPLPGLSDRAGLFHYAVKEHGLETRRLFNAAPASPAGGFLVGLSSVAWREAWKYGERAFRYVLLDGGHAVGALAYAAAALGWRAQILPQPSDAELAGFLGLTRDDCGHAYEVERPELLIAVTPGPAPALPSPGLADADDGEWFGAANRLSDDHDPWPLVDAACRWTEKPALPHPAPVQRPANTAPPAASAATRPAESVIRARRSVQRMDGVTPMAKADFFRTLAATLPSAGGVWDAFPWPPRLALILFVHRVEGLAPGRYALIRDPDALAHLQAACRPEWRWEPVDGAPANLPLYLLLAEPADKLASQLSCLQAIAGKGAFAAAMVADFARTLDEEGDWAYRRLHWEAGLLGQVLYLEATAAGLAGTGIGCFFDDEVAQAAGLPGEDMAWRPVYNFTIGGGVEDARILTLPAYAR